MEFIVLTFDGRTIKEFNSFEDAISFVSLREDKSNLFIRIENLANPVNQEKEKVTNETEFKTGR